jgi:DNA-binding LacI/PurR family transcriptional regulator
VALGHRRIVFVNHSAAEIDSGYGPAWRTRETFTDAMTGHGLEPLMIPAEDTASGGRRALGAALDRAPDLTGILAMNESALFGILGGLGDRGIRVPDDVSVVSMVTSPQVAELANPALTALTSPGSALGRIGLEVLLNQLSGEPGGEIHQELLPCTLQVRGTSGPPPG